jgi:hypothetical protein
LLEVNEEDIWPHYILDTVTLDYANEFVRRRTRQVDEAAMEASLFQYEVEFPDREMYSTTMAMRRHLIAKVCAEDNEWAREFQAILTPVTQAIIRLEDIRCEAGREFAALTEKWLGVTSHHERQVKRNLDICAYNVYNVYRVLLHEHSGDTDISKATHAAASTLIFMIESALNRYKIMTPGDASLWEEMTQLDYIPDLPTEFWTITFRTFHLITPEGLKAGQRADLRSISRLAQERTHPHRPIPGILAELVNIRRIPK